MTQGYSTGDAVETIVLGPLITIYVGIIFYVAAYVYVTLWPNVAGGPFADAYTTVGAALSITYSLFQLASTIETWIAIAFLAFTAYAAAVQLTGGNQRRR